MSSPDDGLAQPAFTLVSGALAAHVAALKQLLADTLRGSFLLPVDAIRAAFARDGGAHPALFLPEAEGGPADATWHSMDLLRLLGSLLERPVLLGAVSDAVEYAGLVRAAAADDDDDDDDDDGNARSRSPSAWSRRSVADVGGSDARSSDRSASDALVRRLPRGPESPRLSLPEFQVVSASTAAAAVAASSAPLSGASDERAEWHACRARLKAVAAERQRERAQSEADARQCADRIAQLERAHDALIGERDRLARLAAAHEAERNSLAQLLADLHAENVRLRSALAAAALSSPPSPNVALIPPASQRSMPSSRLPTFATLPSSADRAPLMLDEPTSPSTSELLSPGIPYYSNRSLRAKTISPAASLPSSNVSPAPRSPSLPATPPALPLHASAASQRSSPSDVHSLPLHTLRILAAEEPACGAKAVKPEEHIMHDSSQPGAYLSAFHGPDGTELESRHGFFLGPHGIAMDAKRDVLIVADRLNHRVVALRRTTLELVWQHGKTAESAAGADRLYYPHGVALDHAHLLVHVADCRNHRIVSLLAADGTFVSAFGGGGGVASRLANPSSVCTTPDGCVWVADSGNHRVVCFNARSQPWVPLLQLGGSAGGGAGAAGSRINQFSNPFGVAHMHGDGRSLVLVADAGNHRVQVFDAVTGVFVRTLGSGDGGDASTRRLCEPVSVCVAHDIVYVCEWGAVRVAAFAAADFRPLGTFGGDGLLSGVRCLCVTPDGAEAFVTDSKQHRVAVFRAY